MNHTPISKSGKWIGMLLLIIPLFSLQAQEKWTLQQCIDYAIANNIQVKQNEINVAIAKQNVLESKMAVLPNLNGFATNTYNFGQTIDPFTNQFATTQVRSNNFSLNSQVVLFNGFQTLNNIKRTQADLGASEKDLQRMMNDISLNVANAYLQVLFNKELLQNATNQLAVSQVQRDRIAKLVEAGSQPKGSLLDIEAQMAGEELQEINAKNALEISQLNLKQLLRLEADDEFETVEPNLSNFDGSSDLINPGSLYETSVGIMPEIKAAEYRLYSAEKSLSVAKGGQSPTLSLSGSLGTGYSGASRELDQLIDNGLLPTGAQTQSGELVVAPSFTTTFRDKTFADQLEDNVNKSIGFTLNIPIFNRWTTRSNIKRARLNMENSALALENEKLQLRQNIESAHRDAIAALKRYKAAEKSVTALNESFKYTQERFNVGLLNAFDYSNEKNRLTNAESELLQAKYDYIFKTKVLDFYQGKALGFTGN